MSSINRVKCVTKTCSKSQSVDCQCGCIMSHPVIDDMLHCDSEIIFELDAFVPKTQRVKAGVECSALNSEYCC